MNHDIIQIHQGELIAHVVKHLVHESLKGRRRITQSERHSRELIQAIRCDKRRLRRILILHVNLPVATGEVHSGEVLATSKLIKGSVNPWQRVDILKRDTIQAAVVYTEPGGTILLWY